MLFSQRVAHFSRGFSPWVLALGVLLCLASASGVATAQSLFFSLDAADTVFATSYTASGITQDSIALRVAPAGTPPSFALRARRDDGAAAKFFLSRFQMDGWTGEFVRLDSVESTAEFTFTVEQPGGYRVMAVVGTDTLRKVLWLFWDDVELQDIKISNLCDGLSMRLEFSADLGSIRYDKFVYYDLSSEFFDELDAYGRDYFKEVQWTTTQGTPIELYGLSVHLTDPPPLEPVGYRVKVTNIFGREFSRETGVLTPVAVAPKFKVEINEADPGEPPRWISAGKDPRGEAPLGLRLTSESKNTDQLTWVVLNDRRAVRAGAADTLFWQDQPASQPECIVSPELFTAGLYPVVLRATNTASGCRDTATVIVRVDSSQIAPKAIPNAFSPNGDGINDVFRFIEPEKNVRSVRDFEIIILNRAGHVVYHYDGSVRNWTGWDGKQRRTGKDASPGVYFYIIRAKGWDGKVFRGRHYNGALHLFR